MKLETLLVDTDDTGVTTITLNRPEVHNAFDEIMIGELQRTFSDLDGDGATRVVLLKAQGRSFSAGADLNWMKRAAGFSEEENYADAMALANLLTTLDTLSKPVVAFVQGPAYGGGVGLISCCDIVLALERGDLQPVGSKAGTGSGSDKPLRRSRHGCTGRAQVFSECRTLQQ